MSCVSAAAAATLAATAAAAAARRPDNQLLQQLVIITSAGGEEEEKKAFSKWRGGCSSHRSRGRLHNRLLCASPFFGLRNQQLPAAAIKRKRRNLFLVFVLSSENFFFTTKNEWRLSSGFILFTWSFRLRLSSNQVPAAGRKSHEEPIKSVGKSKRKN